MCTTDTENKFKQIFKIYDSIRSGLHNDLPFRKLQQQMIGNTKSGMAWQFIFFSEIAC